MRGLIIPCLFVFAFAVKGVCTVAGVLFIEIPSIFFSPLVQFYFSTYAFL